MQTTFSETQLKNKDNNSSEKIIRKCVHCGMCNATCPTYKIIGDELDGPRGRIYLIKDMLENNKPASKKIAKHIDRCLSCYACMTTCPSGVNYMHLIDHGRNHVEATYKRPLLERIFRSILSFVLPNAFIFRIVAHLTKPIKLISFLLPSFLKNSLKFMPLNLPGKKLAEQKNYPSKLKKTVARVALLTGCVQRVISPQINEATIRLLNRNGVEVVVIPEIECCGSLNHHLGKKDLAHKSFVKNIDAWHKEYLENGLDAIISNTSGCGTTLKDYEFIFRNDKEMKKKAKKISELTKDITEYLSENIKLEFKKDDKSKYKIAYHSPCSMQHGQKVHHQPIHLIKKTGHTVLDIPDGHICCGSAGTYNILQQKIAKTLLNEKVENIKKISPDFISTGNIGCMTQISSGTSIPIVHTVEIIDWFTGGPKPQNLKNI
ncbi:MAG: glycolate oxidase iron-sulfur subunit [Pelagibacterales bacterium MED-G40]|nr:MAG: glycolate oxidase iron-sulfur subunit [Pelagibacterales bacterium MED-G40]|tara:strand:- start:811 stop:2109 length:1299 start_codon:yes stop_codon:yes gene_type:complete